MGTMNISLPRALRSFVDEQVAARGYGTASEYIRELLRKDWDRRRLHDLLLDGAASASTAPADEAYFGGLRAHADPTRRSRNQTPVANLGAARLETRASRPHG